MYWLCSSVWPLALPATFISQEAEAPYCDIMLHSLVVVRNHEFGRQSVQAAQTVKGLFIWPLRLHLNNALQSLTFTNCQSGVLDAHFVERRSVDSSAQAQYNGLPLLLLLLLCMVMPPWQCKHDTAKTQRHHCLTMCNFISTRLPLSTLKRLQRGVRLWRDCTITVKTGTKWSMTSTENSGLPFVQQWQRF